MPLTSTIPKKLPRFAFPEAAIKTDEANSVFLEVWRIPPSLSSGHAAIQERANSELPTTLDLLPANDQGLFPEFRRLASQPAAP
jgi:hypothetical protein